MRMWELINEEISKIEAETGPKPAAVKGDIWSILKLLIQRKDQGQEERKGDVNPDIQLRALLKTIILKQLLWKDGLIQDEERLFFIKYVLSSDEMESDIKVSLILDLDSDETPFWDFLKKYLRRSDFLTTDQEIERYKKVLNEMSYIDGEVDYIEKKFIDDLIE